MIIKDLSLEQEEKLREEISEGAAANKWISIGTTQRPDHIIVESWWNKEEQRMVMVQLFDDNNPDIVEINPNITIRNAGQADAISDQINRIFPWDVIRHGEELTIKSLKKAVFLIEIKHLEITNQKLLLSLMSENQM